MPHAPGHWSWNNNPVQTPIYDENTNLSSLFGNLNKISADVITGAKTGGGTGGGSEVVEGNMDANRLIGLSPYMDQNVTSFDYGGKYKDKYDQGGQLTPAEMKKVQSLGRRGDTQLAHINPQEAQMLKAMGGSGTINPYTGLREYGWLSKFIGKIMGGAKNVTDKILDVAAPVFDSYGNIITPGVEALGSGANWLGENVLAPGIEGIAEGTGKLIRGVGDMGERFGRAVLTPPHDVVFGIVDAFGGGDVGDIDLGLTPPLDTKRGADLRGEATTQPGLRLTPQSKLAQLQKDKKSRLQEGDWVGDKPNPYIAPNIEEEIDYAAKGMKMPRYDEGGMYEQAANQAVAQNQLSGLLSRQRWFSNNPAGLNLTTPPAPKTAEDVREDFRRSQFGSEGGSWRSLPVPRTAENPFENLPELRTTWGNYGGLGSRPERQRPEDFVSPEQVENWFKNRGRGPFGARTSSSIWDHYVNNKWSDEFMENIQKRIGAAGGPFMQQGTSPMEGYLYGQSEPKAANGMKMPFDTMASDLQREIPNPQDAMNLLNQLSNDPTIVADKGMKMQNISNKERLTNLLKAVPNKEAFNELSEKDKKEFMKSWKKYGGVTTPKRYTQGGRF